MANKNNGLGKGLGALLNESDSSVSDDEVVRNTNLPDEIEVDENGSLWIDPRLLKPNPNQPRVEFNQKDMDELADSIRVNGVLQAIIIEHTADGTYYIIAGERRTRAAIEAGLTRVPVQLRKYSDEKKLEVALIENIQRTDLNPIEEANAYANLIKIGHLSQEEVARRVGKSRSAVANSIRLLNLSSDIQNSLITGEISAGHARALLMAKNIADMQVIFEKVLANGLSVRETEALADFYNKGGRATSTKTKSNKTFKDADVRNFEQNLRNIFGTPDINLKGDMNKGSLVIGFTSQEVFDRIYNVLMELNPDNVKNKKDKE